MKCSKCGAENKDNAKFCKKCGYAFNAQTQGKNTKNILIIALTAILCVAMVSGALIYLNSNGGFNLFNEKEPVHIINTTFTTEHSLSAKTVCTINVGANHTGENITVNILYSRDGSNLNDGDKSTKTVDSEGNMICESEESYDKYPDHATVTLYDEEGNELDSADVSLNTDDSTQLAVGNGTVTAKSITTAQHSASSGSSNSASSNSGSSEWVEDLDLSDKAGYDCHVYIHHKSDGTKYYVDDEGNTHTGAESEEWVF